MSSGDFVAELQQSVRDHIALIHTAAAAAKARIGQTIEGAAPPAAEPSDFEGPRPAVNFFADEPDFVKEREAEANGSGEEAPAFSMDDPAFASAFDGAASEPLPEGAITFPDDIQMDSVDDDGIPMWEDPP